MRDRLRRISPEGLEKIGSGFSAVVYKLNDDQVVKVFRDIPMNTPEYIEHEYLESGEISEKIPECAKTLEMVRAGEGYGIVYEYVHASSLDEYLAENPGRLEEVTGRMAALLKKLHQTGFEGDFLPDIRFRIIERVRERLSDVLSGSELKAFAEGIRRIPDENTMVHGDFNRNNILIDGEGRLRLIDVGNANRGHPVFDFGTIMPLSMPLKGILSDREYMDLLTGGHATEEDRKRLQEKGDYDLRAWRMLLAGYFGTEEEGRLTELEDRLMPYSYAMLLFVFAALLSARDEATIRIFKGLHARFVSRAEETASLKDWWSVSVR